MAACLMHLRQSNPLLYGAMLKLLRVLKNAANTAYCGEVPVAFLRRLLGFCVANVVALEVERVGPLQSPKSRRKDLWAGYCNQLNSDHTTPWLGPSTKCN